MVVHRNNKPVTALISRPCFFAFSKMRIIGCVRGDMEGRFAEICTMKCV